MKSLFSWLFSGLKPLSFNKWRLNCGLNLSSRTKLLLKLCLSLLAVLSLVALSQETRLAFLSLQRIDPVPQVQHLLEEKRYAEADQYLRFFMDFDYVKNNPVAVNLMQEIEAKRSSWGYKAKKLGEGLWKGESDETIGQMAGVVSDFLVIGDLRDLAKEATKYVKGEENDKVIIALSSFGLLADAATVAAGASTVSTAGATTSATAASATANVGASMIKILHKAGKLPQWLFKSLMEAANAKNFDKIKDTLVNLGNLSKYRGSMKLVAESKHADDLPKLLKFAEMFGNEAVTMYEIGGKTALKMAQQTGKYGKDVMKLAASYGKEGLIFLDKIGAQKFVRYVRGYKSFIHTGKSLRLLAKITAKLPNMWLYLIVLLGVMVWLPYSWVLKKISAMLPKVA